jgi:RNA polymerase sigma factor (sigma-70 family)
MDSKPLRNLLDRLRPVVAMPGDGLDDGELLRRFVRRRDEAAFELLVWRHGPMVLGVCRRVLRDRHAADDAFQATFLVLVRKAVGIARGGAVGPWLFRVAFRIALRSRAAAARRAAEALPLTLPAPNAGLQAERDWLPILDEEINGLSERYRQPVVLCHLQGHTLAEAARRLGCPRGTVAVRLMRARQQLRARLTRRGVALSAAWAGALACEAAVSASLVKPTVRAALGFALGEVAGILSPSVLTLTEGALHAMFLNKIKVGAAVLVATVLVGTGAAWVTYPGQAGEPPPAATSLRAKPPAEEPPARGHAADRRAEDRRAIAQRRGKEQQKKRLERAEALLEGAEADAAAREAQWLEELVNARVKVMELRDELKAKERDLNERSVATDPRTDVRMQSLLDELTRTRQQLEQKMRLMVKPENDPDIRRLRQEVEKVEGKVKDLHHALEHQAAERKEQRDKGFLQLRRPRRELVEAEEKLLALQRRQERQREEARRDLEEKGRRVRQWRQAIEDAESDPQEDLPTASLERKLDRALRELAELRRALRRQEEKRPEEP